MRRRTIAWSSWRTIHARTHVFVNGNASSVATQEVADPPPPSKAKSTTEGDPKDESKSATPNVSNSTSGHGAAIVPFAN
jgi:hypothetical protein